MPAIDMTGRHQQLYDALEGLLFAIDSAYEGFAQQQNLHPTDVRCLLYLDGLDAPVSPKIISQKLKLTTGSTTALLDRLEAAGLLRRRPNPADRRGLLIELIREDGPVLSSLRRLRENLHDSADQLAPEQAKVVVNFLNSLSRSANEMLDEWRQHSTKGQS